MENICVKNEIQKAYEAIISFRQATGMSYLFEHLSDTDLYAIARSIANIISCTEEISSIEVETAIVKDVIIQSMTNIDDMGDCLNYVWMTIPDACFKEIVEQRSTSDNPKNFPYSKVLSDIRKSFDAIMLYRQVNGEEYELEKLERADVSAIAKAISGSSNPRISYKLGFNRIIPHDGPSSLTIEEWIVTQVINSSLQVVGDELGWHAIGTDALKEIIKRYV